MEFRETTLDAASWDKTVSHHGGALQQSWRYGQFSRAVVRRFELMDGPSRIALAQVLTRQTKLGVHLAMLLRGPVWVGEPRPVKSALQQALGRHLLISSAAAGHCDNGVPVMSPAYVAQLCLRRTADELFAGLHGKWRNRLRAAQKSGLRVYRSDEIDWILAREVENQRTYKYRGYSGAFTRSLCASRRDYRLFIGHTGDDPLAAALFLCHGSRSTYQIGWSSASGRKHNAQNAVFWSAVLALRKEGFTSIDLGSVDTVRAPGLARFKLGTGADLLKLGPTCLSVSLRRAARKQQNADIGSFPQGASMQ